MKYLMEKLKVEDAMCLLSLQSSTIIPDDVLFNLRSDRYNTR